MKKNISILVLTILSACSSYSGSTNLKNKAIVNSFMESNPTKEMVMRQYSNGFVGSFKQNNENIYEFNYNKVSFNWLATVPILGLFTKTTHKYEGNYLYVYFDKKEVISNYKFIRTNEKFDGWKLR